MPSRVPRHLAWPLQALLPALVWGLLLLGSGCAPYLAAPSAKQGGTGSDFVIWNVKPGQTLASIAEKVYSSSAQAWIIADFNEVSRAEPGDVLLLPLSPFQKGGLGHKGFQKVPVLTYHKFSVRQSDAMTVSKADFEKQMAYLQSHGYRVISLQSFYDFLHYRLQIPERSVVITIDDGWRSTYSIAWPVLKAYGYPATLFLYTDLVTGTLTTLDWNQLREMQDEGLDIQCHTKSHRDLNRIGREETFSAYFAAVQDELELSTASLRDQLQIEPRFLAYPYGETNDLVIAMLQSMGYQGGLTVQRGSNAFDADPYRVKRSMIYGGFSLADFERNLHTFETYAPSP